MVDKELISEIIPTANGTNSLKTECRPIIEGRPWVQRINVPMVGGTVTVVYATLKQLEKLNSILLGKEIFLSSRYCQIGGGFWVVRTSTDL